MSIVANTLNALMREPDATAVVVLALLLGIGAGGIGSPTIAILTCDAVAPELAPPDLNSMDPIWNRPAVEWEAERLNLEIQRDLDDFFVDPEAGVGPI